MRVAGWMVLGVVATGVAACGGGGSGGQSCTPQPTAGLTITDSGFVNGANNACVQPGGQVTFTNSGAAAHTVNFDTPSCVTGNAVAVPASGSSGPVTFPNTSVFCNFHIDSNASLSGTIAVSTAVQTGGGY